MGVLEDLANEMHNTLPGKCRWAKILQPDYKYDKDGRYTMEFDLNPGDTDCMIIPLRKIVGMKAQVEGVNAYAPPPFEIDAESKIHTFKFKQDAMAHPNEGEPFKISVEVLDAKMNQWPRNILIGNGSLVRVCFTLWPWNVAARGGIGVTLRPKAVQVIQHVPYEVEDRDYGFKKEEGTDMGGAQPFQDKPAASQEGIPSGDTPAPSVVNPYENHTGGPVVDDIPY